MTTKGPRTRQVGAREVARRAGVSQPTVSRALAGSGRVTQATREKVIRAARELGYQPNMAARLLQGHRAFRIAVVTEEGERSVGPLLGELADCLNIVGFELSVIETPRGNVERRARELAADGFDRVIVNQRAP